MRVPRRVVGKRLSPEITANERKMIASLEDGLDFWKRQFAALPKSKVKMNRAAKKLTRKRLMTSAQKKALIKAIGKNKSMPAKSRKAAISKIKAKKTRKA